MEMLTVTETARILKTNKTFVDRYSGYDLSGPTAPARIGGFNG